ncbi:MAG TPA: tetratricopeptide repeat protein [Paenibacillus lactis]|nr:tetratricopeptide repeat protein [Paenibacillus lactis]
MNMSSVSLCMIVKDEEGCLERCLQSVSGIVREIIIVDTGSTDRTKEIARRFTNHVYDFNWVDDFSAARNYALNFATSDYILHLDADEVLEDPEGELQRKLDKDLYYIRIKNDLGSGLYLTHQFIRLFRNTPEIRYQGALHEQVLPTGNEQTGFLSTVILHEGYKKHIVNNKQKTQRNLNILLKEIREKPTAFNYYNLGMQYLIDKRYSEALNSLKKSYSLGSHYAFSPKVVLDIMKCLHALGQYADAIRVGKDAVNLYENVPDFWYQMGLTYTEWGLLKDAELCLQKCLEIGEENASKLVQHYDGTGSYLAQAKLAEISVMLGNPKDAQNYILLAVKASPNTLALFDIFLSIFPIVDRRDLFQTISSIWPFSKERYVELISYLYSQRKPLLKEFITFFNLELLFPVSVFVYLVEGKYDKAVTELLNNREQRNTDPFLVNNVVFLALTTDNKELINVFKDELPLSLKEIKWLRDLVGNKTVNEVPSGKAILSIWNQLVKDAIFLNKYDLLDLLINATNDPQLRLLIAEQLQSFGFDDLVLEVLVESNSQRLNREIFITASKSLSKLGAWDDALYYLKKAEKLRTDFPVLFEQWKIYSAYNKEEEINVLQLMVNKFPDSKWAKQTIEMQLGKSEMVRR